MSALIDTGPEISSSAQAPSEDSPFAVEVFFDGDCPLCRREIAFLARLDRKRRIRFTDIAAPGFDPSPLGLDHASLMAKIHARLPSGELLEGVEVFRQLYAAVGFERLVKASRWSGVSSALELGYRWFAKNRLRLTGRCDGACAVKTSQSPSIP